MSELWGVNFRNLSDGLIMAVVVAVFGYLANLTSILSIDPKQVFNVAILAGVSYLAKSFSTGSNGKLFGKI